MGKLPWAAEVVAEAKVVVKFITNHHQSQALFREKSALDLLKSRDTRFATNFIMLDRMLEVREALQELVVGREWREWNRKSNHSNDRDEVRDCLAERILEEPGRGASIDKGDSGSVAGVRSGGANRRKGLLGNVQLQIRTRAPEGRHLGVLSWDQGLCSKVCTGACNLGEALGDAAQRHACHWVCS